MTGPVPNASPAASAQSADASLREQRTQRNLKIVIAVMTGLLLLGLGAVIVRMAGFASGAKAPAATATAIATPGGEIALELPKGAKVVSVSLDGNRLAVHHDSPAGTGIAIIDVETGRRIADVKTLEAVPRN
jgi:hypothetical protein